MRVLRTGLVLLLAGLGGCSDSPSETGGNPNGTISGAVRDGGAGVPSAGLTLSGTASRSTTTAAGGGYAFANLVPGAYTVTLTPPAGFALATGEQGAKSVSVTAGQTATVNFNVQSAGTGGPVVISVSGLTWSPADVTVTPGTTVRWVNAGNDVHTVTPDGHTQWADAPLGAGAQFEHTFTAQGTFAYYCTPHRGAGMTGVVRVQ